MFFFFKKLIGACLMPLPLALIVAVAGVLLIWQKKYPKLGKKAGKACFIFSFGWLVVFSNVGVSGLMLRSLENDYPPIPEFTETTPVPEHLKACRYIMVLGGGTDYQEERSALTRLSQSSLARLAEGVRLAQALPEAKLIVSGAAWGDPAWPSMAQEAENAAVSLGMERARILRLDGTRDTREEIHTLKKQAGHEPVVLVTSAFHLRRAMALCQELQVNAIPCPTDYWARPVTPRFLDFFKWSAKGLQNGTYSFHEWLGRLV